MKKAWCLLLSVVISAAAVGDVRAQNIGDAARNFTDSQLAILGLRIAKTMVEADCKGQVLWAETSLGKSGYSAGYEVLRKEGYNKKEMREFSRRNIVHLEAFAMWMTDAGVDMSRSPIDTDEVCRQMLRIAGTDHPVGRFLKAAE